MIAESDSYLNSPLIWFFENIKEGGPAALSGGHVYVGFPVSLVLNGNGDLRL